MDKRSWPWKKKSSDKQTVEKAPAATVSDSSKAVLDTTATQLDEVKQDISKKPKYVQISMESYTHLTGLEDKVKYYEEEMKSYEEEVKSYEEQVKNLEDELKDLNDNLSEAHTEMNNKETMVKKHSKVAEDAIAGWEKAEAESAALKNHLESITLLKLTAEDRASHLDGALKECMRQIRNLKEEHDQKLQEVISNKTKIFEKMKIELEAKKASLDQELLMSAAENNALSRSLQERSSMLIRLNEEKSRADAEIERLRSNIEYCEKDINSLKYEIHIARKEMDIRNEEKNMSVRSAEVANKQHLEGVKKISKLEAECQRLRGLVKKKLPGPAALAQMKLEVARDCGESRLRRSPVKPSSPHVTQLADFSLDHAEKYQKENELLTERLQAMEEETQMLKEALANRNTELQTSRSMCAQTASKLQTLETQLHITCGQKSPTSSQGLVEVFGNEKVGNLHSFTYISEGGNDDSVSCAGSWATVLSSDARKEKKVDSPHKSDNIHQVDLMDDFLEMEKLANLSNERNCEVSIVDVISNTGNVGSNLVKHKASLEVVIRAENPSEEKHGQPEFLFSSNAATAANVANPQFQADPLMFVKLQSQISNALESLSKEKETEKVSVDNQQVMHDMYDTLHSQLDSGAVRPGVTIPINDLDALAEDGNLTYKEICLSGDDSSCIEAVRITREELENAISQIYEFILILGREAKSVPTTSLNGEGLKSKLDLLSAKYHNVMDCETNLSAFVLDVSQVLSEASLLHFNVLGFKTSEVETGSSDCIDKIALPENNALVDSFREGYPSGCANFSDSASDPDVPNDNLVPTSESRTASWKCSLEEFEQLKSEKEDLVINLSRSTENFESTKVQLLETEQLLAEVQSRLACAHKSNSLAETQLKCMAESYRSLETCADTLQTEVNLLRGKIECLDDELLVERKNHQETLTRCKHLQDQLQRLDSCRILDNDVKNQEREMADAAEKLAQCQDTIFLLSKQLKVLRPQTEMINSTNDEKVESSSEEKSGIYVQDMHRESPLDMSNASDSEGNRSPVSSNYPKHRPTKSTSSSVSSTPTPEKQTRGFTRFFSTKGKNGQ